MTVALIKSWLLIIPIKKPTKLVHIVGHPDNKKENRKHAATTIIIITIAIALLSFSAHTRSTRLIEERKKGVPINLTIDPSSWFIQLLSPKQHWAQLYKVIIIIALSNKKIGRKSNLLLLLCCAEYITQMNSKDLSTVLLTTITRNFFYCYVCSTSTLHIIVSFSFFKMSVPPPLPPTSNQSKMVRSSSFSSQQQTSESAKVNLFACCLLISSLSFEYYCIIKTRNSHSTFLARVTGFCASSCHSSCIPLVGWKCKNITQTQPVLFDLTHAFTT